MTTGSHSMCIRQEIQRFESVHPSIYAIYDYIEVLPDPVIASQIREHVVSIEDAFVNSQEWTLGRGVPDLRLGLVGSLSSGKSALVHRYLTGAYVQEESPEGGRFKKEVHLDQKSHLLLIRDEGGAPQTQFANWVDAVVFVFSVENEASFNAVYTYYNKIAHFRDMSELPILLVGTQDAISETHPRVIDDARARKLASEMNCVYYETCATYGLNVDRVFHDACQKIIQSRAVAPTLRLPSTLNGISLTTPKITPNCLNNSAVSSSFYGTAPIGNALVSLPSNKIEPSELVTVPPDVPTPISTPNTTRKSRRRSNLFSPSLGRNSTKWDNSDSKDGVTSLNGEVGVGRQIPLKQGFLYKRSSKPLNKEWKKKYVTLGQDGTLMYYSSINDYMENAHGKEIPLHCVTVKVPGSHGTTKPLLQLKGNTPGKHIVTTLQNVSDTASTTHTSALESFREASFRAAGAIVSLGDTPTANSNADTSKSTFRTPVTTTMIKKRHRRLKSIAAARYNDCGDDSDGYEFCIVSLENRQWLFEATNGEERDEWVSAIEQQIRSSLLSNESSKKNSRGASCLADAETLRSLRTHIPGNQSCCDCDAPDPDWASINTGSVICIECSGIHRNLGSHISRVKSLDLDDWTPGPLSVMLNLGNAASKSIWEGRLPRGSNVKHVLKPNFETASREDRENWIRAKYEKKDYIALLPPGSSARSLLLSAITRNDVRLAVLALCHAKISDINNPATDHDPRTPLHLAALVGNLAIVQVLLWNQADMSSMLDEEGSLPTPLASSLSKDMCDIILTSSRQRRVPN